MFSDINVVLYERAVEFYGRDSEAQQIDIELMMGWVAREMPRQEEVMRIALERIENDTPISVNNIVTEYIKARKAAIGIQLATALINNRDSSELLESYNRIISGDEELDGGDSDVVVWEGLSVESLGSAIDPDNLIHLRPHELNERIGGGAMRGSHILVYARPETGKTLFVINMTRGFLEDGYKVLYVGNEDPSHAMRSRIMSSITNKTRTELLEMDQETLDEELVQGGGDNLVFVHLEPGTYKQIRGLMETHEPDVVVVDQIRNIGIGDGLVISQERGGTEMRNIANRYNCLAISIAQAGESANGKLSLELSDIDSSKTGLPAQVDLMVGIGTSGDYESRGKRMVSLPKNKLSGDHSFFSISVNESTSRVVENA